MSKKHLEEKLSVIDEQIKQSKQNLLKNRIYSMKKNTISKSSISFEFVGYILVGSFLGYKMDTLFNTKPVFFLILVFIAFITFFIKVILSK